MARIVDYASLQTAAAEWLWREGDADVAGRTDAFIDFFERGFQRDQRLFEMEEVWTTTITGSPIPLRPGFLEMIRVQIKGEPDGIPNQVLTYVTPDVAATMDATQAQAGTSRYYTIIAGNIFITPQQFAPIGSTLEVASYCFDPLWNQAAGTNWLITTHPDVYLYGSLIQAAAYIDDKDTVAFWKQGHDTAMASITAADIKKKVGGSPLVVRPSMSFVGGPGRRYRY